jgi:hypothetical protein
MTRELRNVAKILIMTIYAKSTKPAVTEIAVRVNAVRLRHQSFFVVRVGVVAVTQSTPVVATSKRGNPQGVQRTLQLEPAASVKFLKGMSRALCGDIAQEQDIMNWNCVIVLTPMFRNVIVPRGRGLGARTV